MANRTITGQDIVTVARRYLGRPYEYGATGPDAFDCSGLVQYTCFQLGIKSCPRTSEEQFTWVKRTKNPSMGDLVFFVGAEQDPPPGHVGIVTGSGQMINAPYTGTVVRYDSYSPNGIGVNHVMGYGQIPRTTISPVSQSSAANRQKAQQEQVAGTIGAGIADLVVAGVIIAFAIVVIGFIALAFL